MASFLKLFHKIAVNPGFAFNNHKGSRVDMGNDTLHMGNLVFGHNRVKHFFLIVGITADALPAGDSSAQSIGQGLGDLRSVVFGDNQNFHIDILRMH